jgi:hypothetical protein
MMRGYRKSAAVKKPPLLTLRVLGPRGYFASIAL